MSARKKLPKTARPSATVPACLQHLDGDSVSLGGNTYFLARAGEAPPEFQTLEFLILVRDSAPTRGMWAPLHNLCEDDSSFEKEASLLLEVGLNSLAYVKLHPRIPKKQLRAGARRVAADARRLRETLILNREFTWRSCSDYLTAPERLDALWGFIPIEVEGDLPTLVHLMDALAEHAERVEALYSTRPALKVDRPDFGSTLFLKAICLHMLKRFPHGSRTVLADIAGRFTFVADEVSDADFTNRAEYWLSVFSRAKKR